MMTTMAALLGGTAACCGNRHGIGTAPASWDHYCRRTIVSQLFTLYTTPVVYLYLDRLSPGSKVFEGGAVPGSTNQPIMCWDHKKDSVSRSFFGPVSLPL